MKRILIILYLILPFITTNAQDVIVKPDYLNYEIDKVVTEKITKTLDSLFIQISQGKLDTNFLTTNKTDLTISTLEAFQTLELKKDSLRLRIKDKQLINIHSISKNKYSLSIAYVSHTGTSLPVIMYVLNLIAEDKKGKITFSIPIDYLTRYWKATEIGNITYHFRSDINKSRAIIFNDKNTQIARKLGVNPEKFDFYMCDNRQEILKLQGLEYSIKFNGKTKDGYGVDTNTIFSIMNNEDFSHDIFHYYSGKINERKNRNWIAEEGIAYLWGNAYYTDENGEMVTLKKLATELEKYLLNNPNTSLLNLFKDNTKIFNHIAPGISVRSAISGIIANEVEKKKGKEGISKLINSGGNHQMKKYLKIINNLIGINESNFNIKIMKLINKS